MNDDECKELLGFVPSGEDVCVVEDIGEMDSYEAITLHSSR